MHFKKQKNEEKNDINLIEKLVNGETFKDRYILDSENAIIVTENNARSLENKNSYIMIHQRIIDGKLVEINRWFLRSYYFGNIHGVSPLKELGLFKVQNGNGEFDSLYDYKNDKFVIPQSKWSIIDFGRDNYNLEKYNGVLGVFGIRADYEEDDVFSYINEVTGKTIVESFGFEIGDFYAIINLDGTIRGNKLFRGSSFSRIEEIIDLDEYESLEDFKLHIKGICNERKRLMKENYYEMISKRKDSNISPYLDSEVAKILKLK